MYKSLYDQIRDYVNVPNYMEVVSQLAEGSSLAIQDEEEVFNNMGTPVPVQISVLDLVNGPDEQGAYELVKITGVVGSREEALYLASFDTILGVSVAIGMQQPTPGDSIQAAKDGIAVRVIGVKGEFCESCSA
jgi:hypothetical protein